MPVSMDRRLRPNMRFNRDRRSVAGDDLSRILLAAPDAVSFDDLLTRLTAADIADVAGWVAHAIERGYIEELPPADGLARRVCLPPGGARGMAPGPPPYDPGR